MRQMQDRVLLGKSCNRNARYGMMQLSVGATTPLPTYPRLDKDRSEEKRERVKEWENNKEGDIAFGFSVASFLG
jgi:hypothetical protein